jgi:hypothetical protein
MGIQIVFGAAETLNFPVCLIRAAAHLNRKLSFPLCWNWIAPSRRLAYEGVPFLSLKTPPKADNLQYIIKVSISVPNQGLAIFPRKVPSCADQTLHWQLGG